MPLAQVTGIDGYLAYAYPAACGVTYNQFSVYLSNGGSTTLSVELGIYNNLNLAAETSILSPANSYGWVTIGISPVTFGCGDYCIFIAHDLGPAGGLLGIGAGGCPLCRSDSGTLFSLLPATYPNPAILSGSPNGGGLEMNIFGCGNTATQTPTATSTPTSTATPTPTLTPTSSNSPTVTSTFPLATTPTLTSTPSATNTQTFSFTNTYTTTPTITPTSSPTSTPTTSATTTLTPTLTHTPTLTTTGTITPTAVNTTTPTTTQVNETFFISQNLFRPSQGMVTIIVSTYRYPGALGLKIYNSAGEYIQTLDDRQITAPFQKSYTWNGTNCYGDHVASGLYYFILTEPAGIKRARLLLVR